MLLYTLTLVAWCLVQGVESSLAEALSPPPSFRVSMACSEGSTAGGYDVVVTNKGAGTATASWRDRKRFRGLPVVATSRGEAELTASGEQAYHIFVVKQNSIMRFPEGCRLKVHAGAGVTVGSVKVGSDTSTADACKALDGTPRPECSLWQACELRCANSACEVRKVNHIEHLETDLIEDDQRGGLGSGTPREMAPVTAPMIEDAQNVLHMAEEREQNAAVSQAQALRHLKELIDKKDHKDAGSESAQLKSTGEVVKKEIQEVLSAQQKLLTLKKDFHEQQLAANQTRLARLVDQEQRAAEEAADVHKHNQQKIANVSIELQKDQRKAVELSKLMGEAEASLKVAMRQKDVFEGEHKMVVSQVHWLSREYRQAKERAERMEVEIQKLQVEMAAVKDSYSKKQLRVKLTVLQGLQVTAQDRLKVFDAKLNEARNAYKETKGGIQDMERTVAKAQKSWSDAETQWEDVFKQIKKREAERVELERAQWTSSLTAADMEQQALSTSQHEESLATAAQSKLKLERARYAVDNAEKMKKYYSAEETRLTVLNQAEKKKLEGHVEAAALASAKAKAANIALATAESQGLQAAKAGKQANSIERNARKVALLRAQEVERLTGLLKKATQKEVMLGKVDVEALEKNKVNMKNQVVIYRFKLRKAQKAAVAAVSEARKNNEEVKSANATITKVQGIISKYKAVFKQQSERSHQLNTLLDQAQSENDATVAEITAINQGLAKVAQDLKDGLLNVKAIKREQIQHARAAARALRKMEAANALRQSKEAATKSQMVAKEKDKLHQAVLKAEEQVVHQVDLRASAHAEGHICLVRLQRVKQQMESTMRARQAATLRIQQVSRQLVEQDNLAGKLRIEVKSTSDPASEKKLSKRLTACDDKRNELQQKLLQSFEKASTLKARSIKSSKLIAKQESTLSKSLAESRQAKAMQELDQFFLKNQREGMLHLENYHVKLEERVRDNRDKATRLIVQSADDDLKEHEHQSKIDYVASMTMLRGAQMSGIKYGEELSELGQTMKKLRQNFTLDVKEEEVDKAKAQHLILGASDAQFVVQQDRERRDALVKQVNQLKMELAQSQGAEMQAAKREADLNSRSIHMKEFSERLKKSRSKQTALLRVYEKQLAHAQERLKAQQLATSKEHASEASIRSEQAQEKALHSAADKAAAADRVKEDALNKTEESALTTLSKAQDRFNESKTFWEHSKTRLFQVQSHARYHLHSLEEHYNHSLSQAQQADHVAGAAISELEAPVDPARDADDITEALKQAKEEADKDKSGSEDMISQALDLVAAEELRLVENSTKKPLKIVTKAASNVATKALDTVHEDMKNVQNITNKLRTGRALWKQAVTTTEHAVQLAAKIMDAKLKVLNIAKQRENASHTALINATTLDSDSEALAQANILQYMKGLKSQISVELKEKIDGELAPYKAEVENTRKKVKSTQKKLAHVAVQLNDLEAELSKDLTLRDEMKSRIQGAEMAKNATLGKMTSVSDAETDAAREVNLAMKQALELEHKGDEMLAKSNEEKQQAYRTQKELKKGSNEWIELDHQMSVLEHTEKQDESRATDKLAKYKEDQATRKQAPLLMQVALLSTSSTAAKQKAESELAILNTGLIGLNSTVLKQREFLEKCTRRTGILKSVQYNVGLLETQAAELKALESEKAKAGKSQASRARENSEKKIVEQKHMAVVRQLEQTSVCKWSVDLEAQVQKLRKQATSAEQDAIAQQKSAVHQIQKAGELQVQAAQYAADAKISVIKHALKMTANSRMQAQKFVESRRAKTKHLTDLIRKSAVLLRKQTLKGLAETSKAATGWFEGGKLSPDLMTTWEQETGKADVAEAKTELQVLLTANVLLTKTPGLEEAFANIGYSASEEFDASVALADAQLAAEATKVKLQQRTDDRVMDAQEEANRLFTRLNMKLAKVKSHSSQLLKKMEELKVQRVQEKSDAESKRDAITKKINKLQSDYSAALVQLNALRNEANFWMKKVNNHAVSSAEKQLPKNFEQESALQKNIVSNILKDKFYTTQKLKAAADAVFMAEGKIEETEEVIENARDMQTFATLAMNRARQEVEQSNKLLAQFSKRKAESRKSAYGLLKLHADSIARAKRDSLGSRHSALSLASEFATTMFSVQTALMKQASTKYRVLKAREQILLKLAKQQEEKANKLRSSILEYKNVAAAEKAAQSGASLAEFRHARSKVEGSNVDAELKHDTAVIAIMDAARSTASKHAEELHKQEKVALELATRFTMGAKAIRAKFPTCAARLKAGMSNVKRAQDYASKTVTALHKVARESDMYTAAKDTALAAPAKKAPPAKPELRTLSAY